MVEKKLITGLRNGDMSAYEQAFHAYYPRFVHFAEYVVKDLSLAKDLVQNAFIKVWRFRDRLQENLSLENYLYVLTKREILNHLRSRRDADTLAAWSADLEDATHDPEARTDVALIRDQLSVLPEQRRKVFELSRFRGLSNKEIARELSLSEKTVERHITLANRQIRHLFQEE